MKSTTAYVSGQILQLYDIADDSLSDVTVNLIMDTIKVKVDMRLNQLTLPPTKHEIVSKSYHVLSKGINKALFCDREEYFVKFCSISAQTSL